ESNSRLSSDNTASLSALAEPVCVVDCSRIYPPPTGNQPWVITTHYSTSSTRQSCASCCCRALGVKLRRRESTLSFGCTYRRGALWRMTLHDLLCSANVGSAL